MRGINNFMNLFFSRLVCFYDKISATDSGANSAEQTWDVAMFGSSLGLRVTVAIVGRKGLFSCYMSEGQPPPPEG